MARKDKEKAQAKSLYMDGRSQKDIASIINVSENTLSKWCREGKWESERAARLFSSSKLEDNKKQILITMSEMVLDLQKERKEILALPEEDQDKGRLLEISQQIVSMSDAANKTDKQGDKRQKENRISLAIYLEVMDDIFNALLVENPKVHNDTIDFQERHVQFISKKLG